MADQKVNLETLQRRRTYGTPLTLSEHSNCVSRKWAALQCLCFCSAGLVSDPTELIVMVSRQISPHGNKNEKLLRVEDRLFGIIYQVFMDQIERTSVCDFDIFKASRESLDNPCFLYCLFL